MNEQEGLARPGFAIGDSAVCEVDPENFTETSRALYAAAWTR